MRGWPAQCEISIREERGWPVPGWDDSTLHHWEAEDDGKPDEGGGDERGGSVVAQRRDSGISHKQLESHPGQSHPG